MRSHLNNLLLGTLLTGVATASSLAQAPSDILITSPIDHNAANSSIFISFVAANEQGPFDLSQTDVNLLVSDGQTGFVTQSSIVSGICQNGAVNGQPGTFYQTCGCYFDLRQVDSNVNMLDIRVIHKSMVGNTSYYGQAKLSIAPHSGPERPSPTAPECAPVNASAPNNPPVTVTNSNLSGTAGSQITLDASASWDPDGDPLTFTWTQTGGPTVALTDSSTANPKAYLPNVTAQTLLDFKVTARDPAGLTSYADDLTIQVNPPSQIASCSPWTRDGLVESVSVVQQNSSSSNYSLKHNITGQINNDLQAEAARLSTIYPNFKRLEIKSYISAAGMGVQPTQGGGQVAGAPPKSKLFEHPVSPVPGLYWMGDQFTEDTWYRLDTKLNVYDTSGQFINTHNTYADSCLYETVYVKLESGGGFSNGLRTAGSQFLVSDGTSVLHSETVSGGNTGVVLGGGQVVLEGRGIRVRVPAEVTGEGSAREIVVTEEDIKKAKKKAKRGWRFWQKKKE